MIPRTYTNANQTERPVRPGYWCVVCGRFLPEDDAGVIVHDNVPHPQEMTFDEEDKPQ